MADSFTTTTSDSWFSRLSSAIGGVVVGLVLFVVAFPLLFWNEGRAVKREQDLAEGQGASTTISADKLDSNHEGKLVHFNGRATTEETLTDPEFLVAGSYLKLQREVEMYQWVEKTEKKKKKKLGGGETTETVYTYEKEWADDLVPSSDFEVPKDHENPEAMPYDDDFITAGKITLGAFTIPDTLVDSINNFAPRAVSEEDLQKVPEEKREALKVEDGKFYLGEAPASPQIGDSRIGFSAIEPTDVTVLGLQTGDTLTPYVTKGKRELFELRAGLQTREAFFAQLAQENTMLTWILRGAGFLMMAFGLGLIFRPITVVADVIPLLGDLLGMGIGLFAGIVALGLSLITIAIGWLAYRPILGISLLAAAGLLLVLLLVLGRKARAVRQTVVGEAQA